MNDNLNKNCPDKNCNGSTFLLYQSKDTQLDNINFNCTTDTYFKPDIFKCEKCHIIYSGLINKMKNFEFENKYSDVIDQKYISQIKYKEKYFKSLLKKINKYLDHEKEILEVGSYYGVFGNILKSHVKSYSGLELSKHGVDFSKKKFDLNIFNETIEEHQKKNIKYDLIIMADVIEHFSDPFKVLSLIKNLLKTDGILILTTFNIDSLYSKFRGYKYHWIIPFHLFYFSNNTLKKIGHDNNLKLFEIKKDPRYVSCEYLFEKLKFIFPKLSFLFQFLLKIKIFNNFSIKVNLGDLNVYFFKNY